MLNLFRMDLRRIFRSRGLYLVLGCLLGILLIAFLTMKLVSDPQLLQKAQEIGMEITYEDEADADEFTSITQSDFISNLLFNGGLMSVLVVICSSILFFDDFRTGFAKNIFSFHTRRSSYLLARLLAMAVITGFFLLSLPAFSILLYRIMSFDNPFGNIRSFCVMMVTGGLALVSLTAQNLFFCTLTRSLPVSIVLSIGSGLGLFSGILDYFTGFFNIHTAQFFPSYHVLMAPYISSSSGAANTSILALITQGLQSTSTPLLSVLISLVWIILYTAAGSALLSRQDIC